MGGAIRPAVIRFHRPRNLGALRDIPNDFAAVRVHAIPPARNRFMLLSAGPGQAIGLIKREKCMKSITAIIGGSLLLATAPALANPGEMSVATFLAKADALRAKGPAALFSGDMKVLKSEGEAAGAAYRARLAAERAAGRPSSCPPPGGKARMSSDQLLAHLRAYPAPARGGTTMKTAMADYFIKTYPCR